MAFNKKEIVLAGDLGGTKMNLALYEVEGDEMKLLAQQTYHCREHASAQEMINLFLAKLEESKPQQVCIGVAGPVINNKAGMVNLGWVVDGNVIKRETGLARVSLINDLEANAYGVACLTEEDFTIVHDAKSSKGNMAIIAPGTGLGEAGLFWDGKFYRPFATEGGHADFAPRTVLDFELHNYFLSTQGTVSWDRVITGPGIRTIYAFLRDVKGFSEPAWLKEAFSEEDQSAVISKSAMDKSSDICTTTMELFTRYLARECSNLVLKLKATGGLFIGGGIAPKIIPLIQSEYFIKHYLDCDRLQDLVKAITIKIIENDKTALMGAAYFAAYAID